MTPELLAYVRTELAAGRPPQAIAAALMAQGWPQTEIDKALAASASSTLSSSRQPAQQTMASQQTMMAQQSQQSKGSNVLKIIIIILLLLLLLGGGAAYYFLSKACPSVSSLLGVKDSIVGGLTATDKLDSSGYQTEYTQGGVRTNSTGNVTTDGLGTALDTPSTAGATTSVKMTPGVTSYVTFKEETCNSYVSTQELTDIFKYSGLVEMKTSLVPTGKACMVMYGQNIGLGTNKTLLPYGVILISLMNDPKPSIDDCSANGAKTYSKVGIGSDSCVVDNISNDPNVHLSFYDKGVWVTVSLVDQLPPESVRKDMLVRLGKLIDSRI